MNKTRIVLYVFLFLFFASCSRTLEWSMVKDDGNKIIEVKTNHLFTGKLVKYYDNGKKNLSRSVHNGKYDGLSTVWYNNGNLRGQGYYTDGKRDGEWVFWEKDGSIEYTRYYKKGERIEPGKKQTGYEYGPQMKERPVPIFKLF
ncbi:MAG: hypothetical protein JXR48_11840 [Candidatus Delongbacteria bacterium]|nr:hypothetical protein [Candidatus Delongbacteria bacterium]MBN2835643.1 hypothetical protein [Candidatus Delongbacteria bacterium]